MRYRTLLGGDSDLPPPTSKLPVNDLTHSTQAVLACIEYSVPVFFDAEQELRFIALREGHCREQCHICSSSFSLDDP